MNVTCMKYHTHISYGPPRGEPWALTCAPAQAVANVSYETWSSRDEDVRNMVLKGCHVKKIIMKTLSKPRIRTTDFVDDPRKRFKDHD